MPSPVRFLALVVVLATLASPARAAHYSFSTHSIATQTITSPLFGGAVDIAATGPQHFELDTVTGNAMVTSAFVGTDLPDPINPGGFLNYDLYNTPSSTTGTIVLNGSGAYDIVFTLLFELKITSGALAGQTFETKQFATFAALDVPSLPFPADTVFSDPNPSDVVVIFAKTSLPGVYNAGDAVGRSSGRKVTILSVVPEPASLAMAGFAGLVGLTLAGLRNHRRHAPSA